jgi:hypothetical protein
MIRPRALTQRENRMVNMYVAGSFSATQLKDSLGYLARFKKYNNAIRFRRWQRRHFRG